MKSGIHPEFRDVIFRDLSCGFMIKTKSTVRAKETLKWEDGKEYPVVNVEISSESHPFYTGQQRVLDTEGRIDKFNKKFSGFGRKKD